MFFTFFMFFFSYLPMTKAYPDPQVTVFLGCLCVDSSTVLGRENTLSTPHSVSHLTPALRPTLVSWVSAPLFSPRAGQGVNWMLGFKWHRSTQAEESLGFSTCLFPHPHPGPRGPVQTDPVSAPLSLHRRSVGDRVCEGLGHTTTTLPEFGEGEPAACSPLPLRHHFGHPAETRFGIPRDFQERTRGPLAPAARATTCPRRVDASPMTLRCLEPSGNGADRTRSQWGTAGSAEEPSPEAARLAKALRELSQTGRELVAGEGG